LYFFIIVICLLCSSLTTYAKEEHKIGAVASGHPLATKAGLEILEKRQFWIKIVIRKNV
jgi:hypothetical protein